MWLATATATAASAGECRDVDYSRTLGPVRDQDNTGWCYAHTAADLITQHLGTRVSAVDLATSYILYDLGQVHGDAEQLARIDFWRRDEPQNYVPSVLLSENGLYNVGGSDQDAILLGGLKGFCSDADLPGGPTQFKKHMREAMRMSQNSKLAQKCLKQSRVEIARIGSIDDPAAQDLARIFQCYVDQKCKRRFKPDRAVVADTLEISGEVGQAQLFEKMDDLLDAGKIVSIGWDSSDVYAADEKFTDHASTVVARKKVNGVCKYRMRDNFGASCYKMQKSFKGHCDQNNGGIWFSRGQIPSLYDLVWIR